MYDEEDYYDEPNGNEGLMTLLVMIGGFLLMILVLYLKFSPDI